MATRFSSTVLCESGSDVNFRAVAQFWEDTLVTTGGWVLTSDTGQTAPASLVHPTVANTKQGYRIYRMNDSLQSTYPVFMRVDFGGSANPAVMGFWTTIGTGSNGSGTITGALFTPAASPNVCNTSNSSTANQNAYGSASTNRATIAVGIAPSGNLCQNLFAIERSKDSTGTDTGDGLLLCYNSGGLLNTSRYLNYAGGAQPTAEALSYVLTARNPSETFAPGDIGVGILIPIRGIAQQPGMNIMIVNSSDVGAQGSFSMTLYGATRTYQHLDALLTPFKATAGSSVSDTGARVCMRYD